MIPSCLPKHLRRRGKAIYREMCHALANGQMASFLEKYFGSLQWRYDPVKRLWIVPDPHHRGDHPEYFFINEHGNDYKARLPREDAQ